MLARYATHPHGLRLHVWLLCYCASRHKWSELAPLGYLELNHGYAMRGRLYARTADIMTNSS